MAGILGRITINDVEHLEVDGDPSAGAGTAAPLSTVAAYGGFNWIKNGTGDTDWDKVVTFNSGGNVDSGTFLRLAIYDSPTASPHVNDEASQNGNLISVAIAAQPTRSAAIEYVIPNPGDGVTSADFVLTEGNQTINGNKTFGNNVIVNGNLTVNGTLTFLNSTNTQITDKLITLNKGGAAASAAGSGIEFEEGGSVTGYLKVATDRNGFELNAPGIASTLDLDLSLLTADRIHYAPDTTGVLVARPQATPGVAGQVAFWQDANNVVSSANLFWDNANGRLGIGTNAPSATLHVVGSVRFASLAGPNKFLKVDANGNVSAAQVSLTADVTGVLPIANGGTNSSTALNNNRVMVSVGGAIVEHSALTQGSVFFADANGLPGEDNANFFWDAANGRLGLGTNAPARLLDVNGSSVFRGDLWLNSAAATKASWEAKQAQVSTTDATTTTLQTIAVPADKELVIEARVLGRRTGGTAGTAGDAAAYVRTARFKNIGGTVTRMDIQTDYTSEDQKSWDATIVASGSNAVVQVSGAANNNIDWAVTSFVQVL